MDHLTEFIAWLKYPSYSEKVLPMMLEPKLKAQTINAIYRTFLHGIADRKREKRYMLHLPVPQQRIRTVAKEDVNTLMKATNKQWNSGKGR